MTGDQFQLLQDYAVPSTIFEELGIRPSSGFICQLQPLKAF